jgi:hypothetical protein
VDALFSARVTRDVIMNHSIVAQRPHEQGQPEASHAPLIPPQNISQQHLEGTQSHDPAQAGLLLQLRFGGSLAKDSREPAPAVAKAAAAPHPDASAHALSYCQLVCA